MKNRWLFIIIIIISVTLILFALVNILTANRVEYGSSQFKIIDVNTRKQIDNVRIIITDLEKEYIITKKDNSVYLPKKPYEGYATSKNKDKGKYPYGYTVITTAEGYLPRIDHNLILGYKDTQIVIELLKTEDAGVRSHYFEEYFHSSSPNIIYDLLNYYDVKQ